MKLVHISRERFEIVKSQGWYFTIPADAVNVRQDIEADVEYHLLEDDYGLCGKCGEGFAGILIKTPVDLEYVKLSAN